MWILTPSPKKGHSCKCSIKSPYCRSALCPRPPPKTNTEPKNKTKTKKQKTAPTEIRVVCKQPKLP